MAVPLDLPPVVLCGHSITRVRWKGRVFIDATQIIAAQGFKKDKKR